jgi:hypothetical protein
VRRADSEQQREQQVKTCFESHFLRLKSKGRPRQAEFDKICVGEAENEVALREAWVQGCNEGESLNQSGS